MSGNTMYFQCQYLIGLGWSALLVTSCSVQRLRTIKSKNTQEVLLKTLQMHSWFCFWLFTPHAADGVHHIDSNHLQRFVAYTVDHSKLFPFLFFLFFFQNYFFCFNATSDSRYQVTSVIRKQVVLIFLRCQLDVCGFPVLVVKVHSKAAQGKHPKALFLHSSVFNIFSSLSKNFYSRPAGTERHCGHLCVLQGTQEGCVNSQSMRRRES